MPDNAQTWAAFIPTLPCWKNSSVLPASYEMYSETHAGEEIVVLGLGCVGCTFSDAAHSLDCLQSQDDRERIYFCPGDGFCSKNGGNVEENRNMYV